MTPVLDLTTNPRAAACLRVLDPATGELVGRIPAGSPEAVDAAVRAARAAQKAWARTPPAERGAALKAAARRLRAGAEELAELVTREGGKPLADALGGVEAGIGAIEQYAELGPLHRGRTLQGAWEAADLMVHEPRGVVALLVPWNDPIAIACGQIAAALVTGNAVVYKPSEKTPLSGARLVELLDLGDVLQLVHGDARAGRPLAAHPRVDLVIHTGSVQTGREWRPGRPARQGAARAGRQGRADRRRGRRSRVGRRAGGDRRVGQRGPDLHLDRAHLRAPRRRRAVPRGARGARAEGRRRPRPGDGDGAADRRGPARLGPQPREDAVHNGAKLLAGGEIPDGDGCFYPPTVLVGPPGDAPVLTQETFGPVAAVRVVDSFDAALEEAGSGEFGLAAVVLTPSAAHAQRAWRELEVGTVKVNAVFGGAPGGAAQPRRHSGQGFGYGPELLDEVTHTKVVHLAMAPERPPA